ncbi:hypothetical protein Pint_01911 [Pistacia integerrima]|uniref:Uncharacterized protein n=1 Tax=Pistacia integerrima TaxID=434235 RepID=A0ACC0ZH13_9ROSI|nr:hypothetical protein Pint_01911 [Pistacia integerrima]
MLSSQSKHLKSEIKSLSSQEQIMASSKTLLLLFCLLFALVLILSSEVGADHTKESNGVEEGKYGGYPGGGGGGYNNGGPGGYNNGGRGGYGGYPPRRGNCNYGCCRGYRYSNGCRRCCAHAQEAPDAEFEDDVKN